MTKTPAQIQAQKDREHRAEQIRRGKTYLLPTDRHGRHADHPLYEKPATK